MLSIPDMAMLGAAALLLFGPEQLPKVARKAGSVMRDIQNTSQSFIREMERAADLQDVAVTKAEPPPYEAAAYDPAPYEATPYDAAAGEAAEDPYQAEPYEAASTPAADYEPPAPEPERPVRRSTAVAEKLAEPRAALEAPEPSSAAEASPQSNHPAHL